MAKEIDPRVQMMVAEHFAGEPPPSVIGYRMRRNGRPDLVAFPLDCGQKVRVLRMGSAKRTTWEFDVKSHDFGIFHEVSKLIFPLEDPGSMIIELRNVLNPEIKEKVTVNVDGWSRMK